MHRNFDLQHNRQQQEQTQKHWPHMDDIKVNGKLIKGFKPIMDLKELPQKLLHGKNEERRRRLQGLHERFWHAHPGDMLRLLQAMLMPRDICIMGAEIARDCEECRKHQPPINRPKTKSYLATAFNETVQHDLFFINNETFMLLIDEAIRWKTGDHIAEKKPGPLLRTILQHWI